jgi:hypothetical protein
MNIGSIGKALASQAMETTKKSVMDAVIPPDPKSRPAETPSAAPKPPSAIDVGAIILGQIQAMQRPLREDQELQVSISAAHDILRVHEVFVPHAAVIVFSGVDNLGNVMRIILPAEQVQLVCKIMPVMPGNAARRVNIIPPKPRPEPATAPPSPAPAQTS